MLPQLPAFIMAMALSLAPTLSQGGNAPAPLTPATLAQLAECKGSADDLVSYAEMLFGGDPPSWLKEVHSNGHPGMISLWTYQLAQPLDVFGHKTDRISFMDNWVLIELPRAEAQSVVAQGHMERAPIKTSEQYFHFMNEQTGPMLGAFAPTDDALDVAFGAPPNADGESKTLFVGCNYSVASKADFLKGAARADEAVCKAGEEIRRMSKGKP